MRDSGSEQPFSRQHSGRVVWLLSAILLVLIGWALHAMAAVAIPLVFALLITVVMAPLDRSMARFLPEWLSWLAHVGVMLVLLAVLMLFFGSLAFAAQQFLAAAPNLSDELQTLLPQSAVDAQEQTGTSSQLQELFGSASNAFGNWLVEQASSLAQTAASMTGAAISTIVIVFFLILLVLSELTLWDDRADALLSRSGRSKLFDMFASLSQRLRQFLLVRSAIGGLQAALYVGWLAVFGIDLLIVWAVLTFVLTFIPNIGSIISGTLPVLYALLMTEPQTAMMIAAGILIIEQVIGNFVDPKILGDRILMSPAVILISLLFWGWLWGISGAFLATPIMLSLLISFTFIPPLRPVALVLSNQATLQDLDEALKAD